MPSWTLGDRLRKARVAAHLTQQEMADRVGVSRPTLSNWESDRRDPPVSKVIAWAEVSGVAVEWLLGVERRHELTASTLVSYLLAGDRRRPGGPVHAADLRVA